MALLPAARHPFDNTIPPKRALPERGWASLASPALRGLSRLAVWWIKPGIAPERTEAAHPEQNGRHERMHRTLKQDLKLGRDWRAQQRQLDQFREDCNQPTSRWIDQFIRLLRQ
jgi:hypothetical protein